MRLSRACAALAFLPLFAGCGYVHFGRLPQATAMGDTAMAEAYSTLATEHKILKQELVLARKEGDTLRAALDRSQAGAPDLTERLSETTRELAALRADYTRLQNQRGSPAADPAAAARLTAVEEKLAASLRGYTELQAENAKLRNDLLYARAENTTLTEQLKSAAAQNEQAQAALAQLNVELLAQKEARARAEQAAAAVRAQLSSITASPAAAAPAPSAPGLSALQLAKAPPADSSATAELRTNPERLRTTAEAPPARVHVVETGDTLELLARKYYNDAQKWTLIYGANNDVLRDGRPLKAGMELVIPER